MTKDEKPPVVSSEEEEDENTHQLFSINFVQVFFTIALFLVEGFVLNFLWAALMVPKFGLPPMGYVQSLGLLLISKMLVSRTKT